MRLTEIVLANFWFAKCASFIKDKSRRSDERFGGLNEFHGDEEQARRIIKAAKSSIGMDTSDDADMQNIIIFTDRMISLALYRKQ
eukprot:gene36421-44922_t